MSCFNCKYMKTFYDEDTETDYNGCGVYID